MSERIEIFVFADWQGVEGERLIGSLFVQVAKGRRSYSFQYHDKWLQENPFLMLDPMLSNVIGRQYPDIEGNNFGFVNDSMPDTWGRTLFKRKESLRARQAGEKPKTLTDLDFLLGINDESRMGAIRIKTDINGPFLNNDDKYSIPPIEHLAKIQDAVKRVENENLDNIEEWLKILLAPGTSLGGARPKANVIDNGQFWIAKFPSKADTLNKAAWEYTLYQLATMAGIEMSECRLLKVSGKHGTFLTKRFDREGSKRVHIASAMTMLGLNEEKLKSQSVSYLDFAELINLHASSVAQNLEQLWRRMVFNIAVSNTDDHLRNHAFILRNGAWHLSPAYDLNPSIDKSHLSLNISEDSAELDFDLVFEVADYFRLNKAKAEEVLKGVLKAVEMWESLAKQNGLSRQEIDLMRPAFRG